jgi:hypothetical protein
VSSVAGLHPHLRGYVWNPGCGQVLCHPLTSAPVGSAEFDGVTLTELANRAYAYKREKVAEAEATGDWDSYVFLHERPYRPEALSAAAAMGCEGEGYCRLLGEVWIDTEAPGEYEEEWRDLLPQGDVWQRWLMDADERAAFASLPDPAPALRGYSLDGRERGFSWTTDYQCAEKFAHRFSMLGGEARVVAGTVPKSNVIAYLLGRRESEVLTLPESVTITSVERLAT